MSPPYAEVIGDPIAQSKSPLIHGFWLGKLGIDGDYRRRQVAHSELDDYFAAARRDPDWRGCNVTMPHKQAVLLHIDRVEGIAEATGAVNTVVPQNGALVGYNTDAGGFLEPLGSELAATHLFRMARVIGTGGAARAIAAALVREHFVVVMAGRDPDKARALLDAIDPSGDHHAVDLAHFADATDFAFDDRAGCFDLVVNASPLGMKGQPPLAFNWSHAPPGAIAYDIVTDPVQTPFLTAAAAAGHRTVDGLAMLIGQAALAFERFFGMPAPRQHDADLRTLLTA